LQNIGQKSRRRGTILDSTSHGEPRFCDPADKQGLADSKRKGEIELENYQKTAGGNALGLLEADWYEKTDDQLCRGFLVLPDIAPCPGHGAALRGLSGTGTADGPYQISIAEGLKAFMDIARGVDGGMQGPPAATDRELRFIRADKAGAFALEALKWAAEDGVLGGCGDGRLASQRTATWVQAAAVLTRYLKDTRG